MSKEREMGNSLEVQLLRLGDFTAEGIGSIPGWETKIPQSLQCDQKKRERETQFKMFYLNSPILTGGHVSIYEKLSGYIYTLPLYHTFF